MDIIQETCRALSISTVLMFEI